MFTKRADFCKKVEKDMCPTKAYWTLLKWITALVIADLVVKLFFTWRLYEAINHNDANKIRYWLKIIGVLFIIGTVLGFWMDRKKLKQVLIESIVGIIITVLFIWYTWTCATALDNISEDQEEADRRMKAFDEAH
jgi:protein-S-isoprenylcysteine O-methyltransferase Ste14